ncbi:MAG: PadR family transcriptional regulator [Methanomassiliicoccales archaeon]
MNENRKGEWKKGFIGLYALSMMEEGPIYGYQLSQRISERSSNAWRPPAGSVYPALKRLADRGFAKEKMIGGRRIYSITPLGRKRLGAARERISGRSMDRIEMMRLFLDVIPEEKLADILFERLEMTLKMIWEYVNSREGPDTKYLLVKCAAELERFIESLKAVQT